MFRVVPPIIIKEVRCTRIPTSIEPLPLLRGITPTPAHSSEQSWHRPLPPFQIPYTMLTIHKRLVHIERHTPNRPHALLRLIRNSRVHILITPEDLTHFNRQALAKC